MTILEQIVANTKERVERAEQIEPTSAIRERVLALPKGDFAFENALKKPGISFICECKKASPSRGVIASDFPYVEIAREYEAAGADCVSVLTEPHWFLGRDDYLREIASTVSIPCLRKDFVVDERMIFEARELGAKAILLICSVLDNRALRRCVELCDELGLSALVETRDETEIKKALDAGARVVGVNNRNLRDFTMDFERGRRLRSLVPDDVLYVSESGIQTRADVSRLQEVGVDAVLIGETLMKAPDKKAKLAELKGLQ